MRASAFAVWLVLGCSSAGGPAALPDAEDDPPVVDAGGSAGRDGGGTGGMGGRDAAPVPDTAVDVAGGVASLDGPAATPDLSPDSPAAPAANPFVYVGSGMAREIRIFQLDLQTGALAAKGSAPSGPSPDYLAFHPNGRFLYAINEVTAGRVEAFSIDTSTGALTRLNDASSGGSGPAHLSVHKSGKWVLVANYGSGHVAALPIMENGQLGAPVAPRVAGAQAHMIVDDGQSGNFVFVPSKGDNRLLQFKFDVATGRLEPNTPAAIPQAGAPRHMAFHRSGKWAFLLTEAGHSVIAYRYDAATGLLSDGAAVSASAPEGDGAHIAIHPTLEVLYTSMRFVDSIATFTIGADGRVSSPPRQFTQQIGRPWDVAIDPTGKFLLVANHADNNIRALRIDPTTGALSPSANAATVPPGPRCVAVLHPPR